MPPKPNTDLTKVPPSTTTKVFNVPRGYMKGVGTDGQDAEYVVPQFLIADLHQAFASHREKTMLGVGNSKVQYDDDDTVSFETDNVGGMVTYPPDPILSEHERLMAHAEITALQKLLGILYKDASHRLYMAELERLKTIDIHTKTLVNISESIKNSLCTIKDNPAVDVKSPEDKNKADKAGDVDQL